MKEQLVILGKKYAETTLIAKDLIKQNFKKIIKNKPVFLFNYNL